MLFLEPKSTATGETENGVFPLCAKKPRQDSVTAPPSFPSPFVAFLQFSDVSANLSASVAFTIFSVEEFALPCPCFPYPAEFR